MRLPLFSLILALASNLDAQQRPPVPTPPALPTRPAPEVVRRDTSDATPARSAYATVFGTVFDSVHMAPLAGATILAEGSGRIARTTDRGIFLLDSLTPGEYRIRVDHVLLDSLGLSMVTEPFTLAEGASHSMELGVPSSATLVALSCPAARRALGPSALIGRLLDAETEEPVRGARVSVAWEEISINAGLRKVPRIREALSGEDGVYRICGLPASLEGTLQAQNRGITTSEVRLRFEGNPLIIQGLKIGNASTVAVATGDEAARRQRESQIGRSFSAATLQRGNASLTGRVMNAAGQPVVGARVDVVNTPGVTQTGSGGEFRLDSLPSGTQTLVVRQIGFAPEEQAVELSTRSPARVTVTMARAAQVLAPVVVTEDANVGLERVGFAQRQRSGFGHYLTGEEIEKRAPTFLTDVFRQIPGLRVVPSGSDYVVESARNALGGCVRYWVDGAVWEAVFPGDVDRLVPPWEIAAMEVYNSSSSVPAQFQMAGSASCAAIVIWTKTRVNAPRGRR
ncbi:MAG: carboxypeptidase regulatory-like domain-containing protein [Gemmatimonadota bacterium]